MTVREFINYCKIMECLDYELTVNMNDIDCYGCVDMVDIIIDDDEKMITI